MSSVKPIHITKITTEGQNDLPDLVAVEEPLEIRVGYGALSDRKQLQVAVTMRTPGHDFELAAGFLFTEGIVTSSEDIESVKYCQDVGRAEEKNNVVRVELKPHVQLDANLLHRNFYTTSSCGVCGKSSLEAITTQQHYVVKREAGHVAATTLMTMSEAVSEKQTVFTHTGGIHASALFDVQGDLQILREDVGRHNALDKLIGSRVLGNAVPLHQTVLWVSGRASFELVQKAAMAAIPIMVAVGAPSSLAVELAESMNITLVGFLKKNKFNIYTHPQRIL